MKKIIFVMSSILVLSSCGKKSDSNNSGNNGQNTQNVEETVKTEDEKNYDYLKLLATGFTGADDIGFNLRCRLQENNKTSVKCEYSFLHRDFTGTPEVILYYNNRYQINVYTTDDYTCSLYNECDDKSKGTCKISYENGNGCKIMKYVSRGFSYREGSGTKGVIFFDRGEFLYTFSSMW
ncbi:MAG: hypothetical protein K2X69_10515 [Silvanigrellaceae bacterium]|nr:hypothetical protein [Silvanigrellaceae bacterium]